MINKKYIVLVGLIGLLLISGCYTGMPVTSPVPEENRGQVLVNIEYPTNTTTVLDCEVDIQFTGKRASNSNPEVNPTKFKVSSSFSVPYDLINPYSKETETVSNHGIAYRFKFMPFDINIPEYQEMVEIAKNLSAFELDDTPKIVCETELLPGITAHIWDEGFEEVKEITTKKIVVICHPDESYCELSMMYPNQFGVIFDKAIPSWFTRLMMEEAMR